jgi:hypothetical protein
MDGDVMSDAATKGWRAGTGRVKFTPDEPMWLAGYAVRTEPARGTLSDLYVTALALEDARGEKLIIASSDIIAFRSLAEPVMLRVKERHPGCAGDNFVFAATHTHYGPEIRPDKALFFNIPPEYAARIPKAAEHLAASIASAIEQALDNLEPAKLHVRHATATFAKTAGPAMTWWIMMCRSWTSTQAITSKRSSSATPVTTSRSIRRTGDTPPIGRDTRAIA